MAALDDDLFARLEQLNSIGSALSYERNLDRLLEKILLAAKAITHADGGTLYRLTDDQRHLRFEIVRTASLDIAFGGTTGQPISDKFPDVPLYLADGQPNHTMIAARCALQASTLTVDDAYAAQDGFDFSGTQRFDQATGYHSRSFLTVPMKNHENEVIGVLQLINATDPCTGQTVVFSGADQRLAESLASQAAVALTNRLLVMQLEGLFESFVELINHAIDEKSPYTGGHCQRVPELTMMLAEAADATIDGPLAGFSMTERDRYELKIAGLLHDCGKVTTPVHVVDKATKLQTIYDRINEIDTRFEVIRRDLRIAALERLAAGDDPRQVQRDEAAAVSQLEHDRQFVRDCNQGGESMPAEASERLQALSARYRWQRSNGSSVDFFTANELENLSIRAGTLTAAERQIINQHIVSTISMLEALPWPKHLRRVPEYAGGHHERMDGKGYPRGLTREQMSIQARILGIADIFEALTARDRPYKEGMKLSQALSILEKFRNNGHIDPDLHEVFVRQRVFETYARRFLNPEQIDL